MISNISVHLHDHQPSQWPENPIRIVTDCLGNGNWIIRIGGFAFFTTPARATELRDSINAALESIKPVVADDHACSSCGASLVDIAGGGVSARLCPVCDEDSSSFVSQEAKL